MGSTGSEVPTETQFLLIQSPGDSDSNSASKETLYTVFLPVLEGAFRASLAGSPTNDLHLIVESGKFTLSTKASNTSELFLVRQDSVQFRKFYCTFL
jgi:raffinose synthase